MSIKAPFNTSNEATPQPTISPGQTILSAKFIIVIGVGFVILLIVIFLAAMTLSQSIRSEEEPPAHDPEENVEDSKGIFSGSGVTVGDDKINTLNPVPPKAWIGNPHDDGIPVPVGPFQNNLISDGITGKQVPRGRNGEALRIDVVGTPYWDQLPDLVGSFSGFVPRNLITGSGLVQRFNSRDNQIGMISSSVLKESDGSGLWWSFTMVAYNMYIRGSVQSGVASFDVSKFLPANTHMIPSSNIGQGWNFAGPLRYRPVAATNNYILSTVSSYTAKIIRIDSRNLSPSNTVPTDRGIWLQADCLVEVEHIV
jgi:Na+-transporting methylmalonyl-CoA/oxaloacetate decarboxylase gamma subunit